VATVGRQMALDRSPGAVLDLPLQFRTGYGVVGDQGPPPGDDSRFMYEATITQRPMAGGSVSRLPERRMSELESFPVYAQILGLQGDLPAETGPATFTPADLHALGIRFVVDHHEAAKPQVVAYLTSLQLPVFAEDASVTVWEVPGGRCLATLKGHTDFVEAVAFSPDGKALASGARDGSVRLWEVAAGRSTATLRCRPWASAVRFTTGPRAGRVPRVIVSVTVTFR